MNREELKALGLDDSQVDNVMASHGKVVNETKEQLESVTTERDNIKEQLTDRDTQLNDLSDKVKDSEELTAEINRLKEENETATTELQGKLDSQSFEHNLENALKGAKVRNTKAVKALLDTDVIKVDGGKLLNLDDQLASLKESDAYLFEEEQADNSKLKFTTGQHQSGGVQLTKEDFSKMNYSDRVKLKKENPDEYETLTDK